MDGKALDYSSHSLKQPWHLYTRQRSFLTGSNLGMLGFQHGNTSLSEPKVPESEAALIFGLAKKNKSLAVFFTRPSAWLI